MKFFIIQRTTAYIDVSILKVLPKERAAILADAARPSRLRILLSGAEPLEERGNQCLRVGAAFALVPHQLPGFLFVDRNEIGNAFSRVVLPIAMGFG